METFSEVRHHIMGLHKLTTDEPFIISFECPVDGGDRWQHIFLAELKAKMSGEPMKMPGMKFMMSPLATFGHSMTFESLQPVFVDAGFELVEHGPWTGYEFNSCSWYAVFQKPVPQR